MLGTQLPGGKDTGSCHLWAEVNTIAMKSGRVGKPQFKTKPKHSCLPLTSSDMTSNKYHKPKVNMFTQTE